MHKDIKHVLINGICMETKIRELAAQITEDFSDKDVVFIGVLKGAFIFLADLVKHVNLDCAIDFVGVSSYGNTTESSGQIKITKELTLDMKDKDVIIVEDILDSGNTLKFLKEYLQERGPASIKICTLLDKRERRKVEIEADYVGFTCPDVFVVGYGLDYAEKYRNLNYIGELKREVWSKEKN